jgi:hypothetical protein
VHRRGHAAGARTGETAIEGTGAFACNSTSSGMSITVCVEQQLGGLTGGTWYSLGCATTTASGSTQYVTGSVDVQVPIASTLLRTVATGSNGAGVTASAKSAPILWVNCACAP